MTKRLKTPISLAIDPDILRRLEAWRSSQSMPVTKTWVIEEALREFLSRREGNGVSQDIKMKPPIIYTAPKEGDRADE